MRPSQVHIELCHRQKPGVRLCHLLFLICGRGGASTKQAPASRRSTWNCGRGSASTRQPHKPSIRPSQVHMELCQGSQPGRQVSLAAELNQQSCRSTGGCGRGSGSGGSKRGIVGLPCLNISLPGWTLHAAGGCLVEAPPLPQNKKSRWRNSM